MTLLGWRVQGSFRKAEEAPRFTPLLFRPKVGEELFLYLAKSPETVNSVLVRIDKKGTQKPIYYVSKVLHVTRTRYTQSEKIIFVLIISSQHLRPYFQTHMVAILTNSP